MFSLAEGADGVFQAEAQHATKSKSGCKEPLSVRLLLAALLLQLSESTDGESESTSHNLRSLIGSYSVTIH